MAVGSLGAISRFVHDTKLVAVADPWNYGSDSACPHHRATERLSHRVATAHGSIGASARMEGRANYNPAIADGHRDWARVVARADGESVPLQAEVLDGPALAHGRGMGEGALAHEEDAMTLRLWLLSMMAGALSGGLVVGGALIVLLPAAVQAAPGDQARSERIPSLQVGRVELLDETGRVRGQWTADSQETRLELRRPDGTTGTTWSVMNTGASMIFAIPPSRGPVTEGLVLGQTADFATISMATAGDAPGQSVVRAHLSLRATEGATLGLFDRNGNARWSVP
jgi:hypothetical protein